MLHISLTFQYHVPMYRWDIVQSHHVWCAELSFSTRNFYEIRSLLSVLTPLQYCNADVQWTALQVMCYAIMNILLTHWGPRGVELTDVIISLHCRWKHWRCQSFQAFNDISIRKCLLPLLTCILCHVATLKDISPPPPPHHHHHSCMLYGELSVTDISTNIICRMVDF